MIRKAQLEAEIQELSTRIQEKKEELETFEVGLNHCILRVYDLKAKRVRVDSTTAKAYVGVSDGGLFQFGHSKDHRPDLPQLNGSSRPIFQKSL